MKTRYPLLLAYMSHRQNTRHVNTGAKLIVATTTLILVAGVSWIELRQHKRHRAQIACEARDAALARQVESIRRDAHDKLTLGASESQISQFFAEQGMAFYIRDSEAFGTLQTTGCAPEHCGGDVLVGVRVKLNLADSVAQEPAVETLYTGCP